MSDKKRINTKSLVDKIEKVTRERIAGKEVVSLDAFRKVKEKSDPPTVLVIDDDETVRLTLKRILEDENYRVISAADASQLSIVLDDQPMDLIILDVGLPWINGFELAQMMKEHEDLKKIPIVFISALNSDEDIKRGFQVGAADYIKKPFDVNQVKKTVKTILDLNR